VRQSWLSQVREMQPLIAFARNQPVSAAAMMAFPTAALVCGLVLAVRPEDRGDAAYRIVAAVFLVALATTFAVIKAYTYAIWLGMPLAAAAALRLVVRLRLRTVAARATVALLLTPGLLASGAVVIAEAAGGDPSAASESPGTSACFDTASYAPLRDLPSGVVAADIDYGPFLLAHTPHSVLAAPYHRLSDGIIAVYRAMQAPPDQAREILQRSTAVYVVVCKPLPPSAPVLDESRFSLRDRLAAGAPPDWLEPLPGTQAGPFQAYRLKP
jgi:hypothetical protein